MGKTRGPYAIGSEQHYDDLARYEDAKYRMNHAVSVCVRWARCGNFPGKCGRCFQHGAWKEKKASV